jgi:hypothetical protein
VYSLNVEDIAVNKVAELTALLAANIIYESLALIALNKKNSNGGV